MLNLRNVLHYMNRIAAIIVLVFSICAVSTALAKSNSKYSLGVRQHVDHSVYSELPFGDGDLSYGIAYEFHENEAFWQVALEYAPNLSGTNSLDYAITPQLNLLFADGYWRAGLGLLQTYVSGTDNDDWTDLYWQFLFGIHLGKSTKPELDVYAHYVFESWSDLGDFDSEDIEFGLWLSFPL